MVQKREVQSGLRQNVWSARRQEAINATQEETQKPGNLRNEKDDIGHT